MDDVVQEWLAAHLRPVTSGVASVDGDTNQGGEDAHHQGGGGSKAKTQSSNHMSRTTSVFNPVLTAPPGGGGGERGSSQLSGNPTPLQHPAAGEGTTPLSYLASARYHQLDDVSRSQLLLGPTLENQMPPLPSSTLDRLLMMEQATRNRSSKNSRIGGGGGGLSLAVQASSNCGQMQPDTLQAFQSMVDQEVRKVEAQERRRRVGGKTPPVQVAAVGGSSPVFASEPQGGHGVADSNTSSVVTQLPQTTLVTPVPQLPGFCSTFAGFAAAVVKDFVPEGGLLHTNLPLVTLSVEAASRKSSTASVVASPSLLPQQQVFLNSNLVVPHESIQELLEYDAPPTALEEVTGPSLARRILLGPPSSSSFPPSSNKAAAAAATTAELCETESHRVPLLYEGTSDTRIVAQKVSANHRPAMMVAHHHQQQKPSSNLLSNKPSSILIRGGASTVGRMMMKQNEEEGNAVCAVPLRPGKVAAQPAKRPRDTDAFLWDDEDGEEVYVDDHQPTSAVPARPEEELEPSAYSALGALSDTTRILQSFTGAGGSGTAVGIRKKEEEAILPLPSALGTGDAGTELFFGQSGVLGSKPAKAPTKKAEKKEKVKPEKKEKAPLAPKAKSDLKRGSRPSTPQPAGGTGSGMNSTTASPRPQGATSASRAAGAKSAPPQKISATDPQYIVNKIAVSKEHVPIPEELTAVLGNKVLVDMDGCEEGNGRATKLSSFLRAAVYLALGRQTVTRDR